MKVLYLGPRRERLFDYLGGLQTTIEQTEEALSARTLKQQNHDFLVCYGYRRILGKDVLDLFPDRAINLHISFLPWNRGADPNLWSFIEDTPKGVSVHYIDEGIDTGDIIAQRRVEFSGEETLASSYEKLQTEAQQLFMEVWPSIVNGSAPRRPQESKGSFHTTKDKQKVKHLLIDGWDTVVSDLTPA